MPIIDLSLPLEAAEGEPVPLDVDLVSHEEGAALLGKGHGITRHDFPDSMAISLEKVRLTSHMGTHMDAPLHYGPTTAKKRAKSIDEVPLEWCYQKGVVIDVRKGPQAGPITKEEIETFVLDRGITIEPLTIVLLCTGADHLWGRKEYFTHFRGLSLGGLKWLLDKGVKVVGVDSFGLDPPFDNMIEKYKQTQDKNELWPCHIFGRTHEYCQLERLANLHKIVNAKNLLISCFPIPLKGCGASWARVVGVYENETSSHYGDGNH